MKRKELEKKDYTPPYCELVKLAGESFFCTSVNPDIPNSSEENWSNEEESEDEIDF